MPLWRPGGSLTKKAAGNLAGSVYPAARPLIVRLPFGPIVSRIAVDSTRNLFVDLLRKPHEVAHVGNAWGLLPPGCLSWRRVSLRAQIGATHRRFFLVFFFEIFFRSFRA